LSKHAQESAPAEYSGLTQAEAQARLDKFGPNSLPEPEKPGLLAIFIHQYKSPFIYVLLAAALVSFVPGQYINCVFIFLVLLLNASIGAFSGRMTSLTITSSLKFPCRISRDCL